MKTCLMQWLLPIYIRTECTKCRFCKKIGHTYLSVFILTKISQIYISLRVLLCALL